MATFNYIHAVWRNGPGVVSDAPGWVRASIERVLTDRLPGWDSGLVGTGADGESGLGLWILVSPSAARGAGGFAGLPVGSFVHVVASDATVPPAAPDAAGHLFEAVYGPSLSDAVLRQQDAFMLLEHPYHETLAAELFVSKQLLEGDDAPSARPDPLPFDQGLSYQEVVTRLAESAMRQARTAPDTIPQLGSSPAPAPVLPAPAPGPSLAAPAPVIDPDEVGAGEEGEEIEEEGGAEPGDDLSLSALLRGGGAAKPSAAAASPLPFNEGLSYDQVLARMETALETSSGVPQTKAVRPPPAPARTSGRGRRDRPGSAFGPGAELLAAASFLVLAVLVAAAVLLRMPEAPPPATVAGDPPSQPQRAAPEPRLAPAPVVEQPPVVPAPVEPTPAVEIATAPAPREPVVSTPKPRPTRTPVAAKSTRRLAVEPEPESAPVVAHASAAPAPVVVRREQRTEREVERSRAAPAPVAVTSSGGEASAPVSAASASAAEATAAPSVAAAPVAVTAGETDSAAEGSVAEAPIETVVATPAPSLPAVSAAREEAESEPEVVTPATEVSASESDERRVDPGVERRQRERRKLIKQIRGYR